MDLQQKAKKLTNLAKTMSKKVKETTTKVVNQTYSLILSLKKTQQRKEIEAGYDKAEAEKRTRKIETIKTEQREVEGVDEKPSLWDRIFHHNKDNEKQTEKPEKKELVTEEKEEQTTVDFLEESSSKSKEEAEAIERLTTVVERSQDIGDVNVEEIQRAFADSHRGGENPDYKEQDILEVLETSAGEKEATEDVMEALALEAQRVESQKEAQLGEAEKNLTEEEKQKLEESKQAEAATSAAIVEANSTPKLEFPAPTPDDKFLKENEE